MSLARRCKINGEGSLGSSYVMRRRCIACYDNRGGPFVCLDNGVNSEKN